MGDLCVDNRFRVETDCRAGDATIRGDYRRVNHRIQRERSGVELPARRPRFRLLPSKGASRPPRKRPRQRTRLCQEQSEYRRSQTSGQLSISLPSVGFVSFVFLRLISHQSSLGQFISF